MEELLQIPKTNAIKAFNQGTNSDKQLLSNLFGEKVFKSLFDRVQTFDDVCKEAGVDPDEFTIYSNFSDDVKNTLYYRKVKLIYEVFNAGWKPNFSDEDEPKWFPWFRYNEGSGFQLYGVDCDYGLTRVGSRLCAKSREIVEHIAKYFLKEYNDYLLS